MGAVDLPLFNFETKLLVNWQLARYLTGTGLATFADRLAQVQLLSTVVMSGPDGEGLGSNTLALLLPFVLFSYAFGAQADRHDNRKLLISITVVRALLVLIIPTMLMSLGATGPIIPLSVFALCTCSAFCSVLNFGIIPSLAIDPKHLRPANAAALLTTTTATLAAVSTTPFLSEIWLPHETLRFAAIVYFVAMFFYWTLDRSKTQKIQIVSNDTMEVATFFKIHRNAISIFRLGFFLHFGHGVMFWLFLVFCLQNTQLNNAQSFNLFAAIAVGFVIGSVLSLTFTKHFRGSSLIGYSTLIAAASCTIFVLLGTNLWMRYFLIIIGTTGATTLIAIDAIMQKFFNGKLRAKVFGAILCLSTGGFAIATVCTEQLTTHYSALTILRGIAAGWLIYTLLVVLTSKKLRNKLLKPNHSKRSRTSAESTTAAIKK